MLTGIRIQNFKRFEDVSFDLGQSVVLIGPNNSGKTTALQALALWEAGLRRWLAERPGDQAPAKRPGVTINRRDLISAPVPTANLLWHKLHVRDVMRDASGRQNVRIAITVNGISGDRTWHCGLEFDYANPESFYCRPVRSPNDKVISSPPPEARGVRVAFLPPMSGLADREFAKESGEISVLIGQGQTAQVLRNLCYQTYQRTDRPGGCSWQEIVEHLRRLFGVELLPPEKVAERAELVVRYRERDQRVALDLSSAGRGLQQTLLLLAYLYANPASVLLLDEPDAHLEVLRQRQTYQLLTQVAASQGSQIVAASHSEVLLNEAADRDVVIAFVGPPHRLDRRGSQVTKALTDIDWEHYYNAEDRGWVLYLEGPSDLAILQAFAKTLNHPATADLERPFVHYLSTNLPDRAREHFFGLREAVPGLVGVALFDRLAGKLRAEGELREMMWRRREIENYLCLPTVLRTYARHEQPADLFGAAESQRRQTAMTTAIAAVTEALRTLRKPDPWGADVKASDDFLDPLFEKFFALLGLPNQMRKSAYHELASLVPVDQIDPEVVEKLDAIHAVAQRAQPRTA